MAWATHKRAAHEIGAPDFQWTKQASAAVRKPVPGFLPDCVKQRAIHDRRLLARQDLVPVFDLADIEVVAQQVVQRTTAERYSAARRARREQPGFGSDVAFSEVPYQFVDAAKFQVSPEDQSDQLSFFFDDRDLALFHLVAEGQGASDPKALSL